MPLDSQSQFSAYYSLGKLIAWEAFLLVAITFANWPGLEWNVTYTEILRSPPVRYAATGILALVALGFVPLIILAVRRVPAVKIEGRCVTLSDLPKTRFFTDEITSLSRDNFGFISLSLGDGGRKINIPALIYSDQRRLYEELKARISS